MVKRSLWAGAAFGALAASAVLIAASPAHALIKDVLDSLPGATTAVAEGRPPVPVVVRGESAKSYDDARRQALREAVERVCAVYVKSSSSVKNFELVVDEITAKATGFGQVEVLQKGQTGGRFWVIARVTVSERPILDQLRAAGLLRRWRIAVFVPETHLRRPRIPDPAAETELLKHLTEAGYRVIDRAFSQQYRYDDVVAAAWRGDTSALKLLLSKTRADILVIGEAFSEGLPPQPELPAGMVSCRARVEVRAVVKGTNEVLAAGSAQGAAYDVSEEVAGKRALEQAATLVAHRLVDKVLYLPASDTRHVELVISGVSGLADGERIQKRIAALDGVRGVARDDYIEGMLYLDVELDSLAADAFPASLEKAMGNKFVVREDSKLMLQCDRLG